MRLPFYIDVPGFLAGYFSCSLAGYFATKASRSTRCELHEICLRIVGCYRALASAWSRLFLLLNCIDGSGQYDQDKRQNEANNKSTLISHDLITGAYGALIEGTTNSNPGFVCAAGSCWT